MMQPADLIGAIKSAPTIAIWGFGREGRSVHGYLSRINYPGTITIVADTPIDDPLPAGCNAIYGDAGTLAIADGDFAVVVKSPGISLYRPEVAAGKKAGSIFTSATNIWLAANPGARVIAVTGTKGKSTTAMLVHHFLGALGIDVGLAGNVGRAVLDVENPAEITVLELSSYQIADLEMAPEFALLLNLYPEHIPWHGNLETYYGDKLRLLALEPRPKTVLNDESFETKKRITDDGSFTWYNSLDGFYVKDGKIYRQGKLFISCESIPLPGYHNLSNIAGALQMVEMITGSLEEKSAVLAKALAGFRAPPHRLEVLGEINGVLYVDDSISTTPQSALAALKSFPERTATIILGGQDRGLDYGELVQGMAGLGINAAITIPDNGPRIASAIRDGLPATRVIECENLADAVKQAKDVSPPGSVVLLSPAAPSFGHFRDYAERGDAFAHTIGLKRD